MTELRLTPMSSKNQQNNQVRRLITLCTTDALSVLTALIKEHKDKQLSKKKAYIFSERYKELSDKTFLEDWFQI